MANIDTIQVGENLYGIGGQTIQIEEMPIASEDYVDEIYQYIGDTDEYFTNGYFYKCIEDPDNEGEYIWIQSYTQGNIDLMPAEDMAEIVTPLPSAMLRLPRYSTEEQVVGYWIDGKPLYQKTTVFIGSMLSTWQEIDIIDNDADQFVSYNYLVKDTNTNAFYSLNTDQEKYECYLAFNMNQHKILLKADTAWGGTGHTVYLTYQYTKTTD